MTSSTPPPVGIGLVIGGTGMLAGTVDHLVGLGWDLLVPSRTQRPGPGRWFTADWSRPAELADEVAARSTGPLALLLAWAHEPHRRVLLETIGPLLAPGCPVVEVWASSRHNPLDSVPEPALRDHPTARVVLGYGDDTGERWLTDAEIAAGVTATTLAALSGDPPRVHRVGSFEPWSRPRGLHVDPDVVRGRPDQPDLDRR